MKKDIKNYLQFHLGCQVETITRQTQGEGMPFKKLTGKLIDVDLGVGAEGMLCGIIMDENGERELYRPDQFKLLLRPLSDIQEKDLRKIDKHWDFENLPLSLVKKVWCDQKSFYTADQFEPLLKLGFDLFDLIKDGFAIDNSKKKRPSNPSRIII